MKPHKFLAGAWLSFMVAASGTLAPAAAHAADGCKFLLCIAGSWKSISACVPTVKEVFRDLAKGRPFPTCNMSGGPSNSAENFWSRYETCPPMYRMFNDDSGAYAGCMFPGQINVKVNNQRWSTVYWDFGGNTVTNWSDVARQSLSQPGAAPLDDSFKTDAINFNAIKDANCKANGGISLFDAEGYFTNCFAMGWNTSSGGGN